MHFYHNLSLTLIAHSNYAEILSPSDSLTLAVEREGSSTDTESQHKCGNQDGTAV